MSIEDNKSIARRFVEEVWGQGNLSLEDVIAEGDRVIDWWTMEGTNEGSFAG